MKPAPFRYARAGSLAEAIALLAAAPGEHKLLAGGQSLVPMLNMRLVRPAVRERAPLLAEAARHVGHAAIRNQGTLGGSLAHADPAAELPAALLALDARVHVTGPRGAREIAADALFRGLLLSLIHI